MQSPTSNGSLRVALLDEHALARAAVRVALDRHGIRVTSGALPHEIDALGDSAGALDAVLVAAYPHGAIDLAAIRELVHAAAAPVVVQCERSQTVFAVAARRAGVRGVVAKDRSTVELARAIAAVAAGAIHVDASIAPPGDVRRGVLSPREGQVLSLLARGLTAQRTAASLGVSTETVKTHLRNAMEKLDARTRAHAVSLAWAQRQITLPTECVPGTAPPRTARCCGDTCADRSKAFRGSSYPCISGTT